MHSPLRNALSASAIRKLRDGNSQDLSNTAWAFAALLIQSHMPLMQAISSAAINIISSFVPQHFSSTLWAFSSLNYPLDESVVDSQ